jgi:hypothetical protein
MRKPAVLLALVALGLAASSVYLMRELRSERAAGQSLRAKLHSLQQVNAKLELKQSERQATLAITAPVAAPSTAVTPAASSAGPSAVITRDPAAMRARFEAVRERQRKMLQDPAYRDAMLASVRLSLSSAYADLATALKLDAQQSDQLLDLLARQQMNSMTERNPFDASAGQPAADREQMRRAAAEHQQRLEDEVSALLGHDKALALRTYQRSLGARMQVRQFAAQLAGTSNALRPEQIEPLIAAVAAEQRNTVMPAQTPQLTTATPARNSNDRLALLERQIEISSQRNQRLRDAAATVLSPQQAEQLSRMLEQQLAMTRARLRVMRETPPAESDGGEATDIEAF